MSESAPIESAASSRTGVTEVTAVAEWRSRLTALATGYLLFETLSGLAVWLLPFSAFAQFSLLLHTGIGIVFLAPVIWYLVRHWWVRRRGNLSHYQLLGYIATAILAVCLVSGGVLTWQGAFESRMNAVWDVVHLVTGLGLIVFVVVHIVTVVVRKTNDVAVRNQLVSARRSFYVKGLAACVAFSLPGIICVLVYHIPDSRSGFPSDYNWRFGEDRPFAPSMARIETPWVDSLKQQVADAVGPKHRDMVLASLSKGVELGSGGESIGLFDQVHQCTSGLQLDNKQQKMLELIMTDVAAQVKREGAMHAQDLAGSASCGTSGCHTQIYEEWLPSAHRYASMDDMFQRTQTLMSQETSPEHTRYCAGCHDPISLFSGAKDSGNITLSSLGADEGISCLVCHSIAQADVQGNGDYTIELPERYVYEQSEGKLAKFVSDFLIRTYPQHHITSYSRPLYKTAEFCGACHKQYLDKEVNTDIGKVQGQNQYDSWKNSKWHHEGDAAKTISCRECHMPLQQSTDPAFGDVTDYNRNLGDGMHRSHRTLASNQYIPELMNLQGHETHVALTKQWLRGEIEIPEIADKWTTGPVVNLSMQAPEKATPGEPVSIHVSLMNNKTGHDFPTGPLDMIESWIELIVTDSDGREIYHTGAIDKDGNVDRAQVWFKADGFDRRGDLIDRHNLWDLVGASYKRSLFPGVTDNIAVELQCPSMARGRVRAAGDEKLGPGQRQQDFSVPIDEAVSGSELKAEAILWYRKANPEFLDRVYGKENKVRSPVTEMTRASVRIRIDNDGATETQ